MPTARVNQGILEGGLKDGGHARLADATFWGSVNPESRQR